MDRFVAILENLSKYDRSTFCTEAAQIIVQRKIEPYIWRVRDTATRAAMAKNKVDMAKYVLEELSRVVKAVLLTLFRSIQSQNKAIHG